MTAQRSGARLPYIAGLDYGRAFFSVAVVVWHTRGLGDAAALKGATGLGALDWRGALYYNVLLVAVPFFLTTSLWLYAMRRIPGETTFRRQVGTLLVLTCFWIWAFQLLIRGVHHIDPGETLKFVLTGGDSVFYFFVALTGLTVGVELAVRGRLHDRPRLLIAGLALSLVLLVLRMPIAESLPADMRVYVWSYWSPLGFFPYLFVALLLRLAHMRELTVSRATLAIATVAIAVVAIMEWGFLGNATPLADDLSAMPAYARPSVVLTGMLATWICLTAPLEPRAPITWLAGLSLAIYCVHPFVLSDLGRAIPAVTDVVDDRPFVLFLVVLSITLTIAYPLARKRIV